MTLARWLGCALALVIGAEASAITVRPGFTAVQLFDGLVGPTAATFLPDGRLLVLEKAGRVRAWTSAGGFEPDPLLTLPVCTDSEMGLLGIAVDPAFVTDGYLYLYYTQPPGGDAARCGEGTTAGRVNRVARVTLAAGTIDPAGLVVLIDGIRTDGGNHDGGCLRIGPDERLYVGVGDTGFRDGGPPGASTNPYAQDVQHLEGKILRVNRDGTPPADNPFAGGNAAFVYALGLRNPFRFAFDPIQPGPRLLWVADVGQNTWEEVDVVRAGDDLGWPQCEGNEPTATCPGTSVPPIHVYRHPGLPDESVSITGGVHYDGAQFDESFVGDYFFGDFGLDQVYRAEVNASRDGIDGDPETFANDAGSPVDFLVGPDGALYWVAIGTGAVVRVTQDGRPGAAIGACERRAGTIAARILGRAAKRLAACYRRGETTCDVQSGRAMRRRLARQAARSCDAGGRARVCARLGCATCASIDDLVACVADATASTALSATPLGSAAPSSCRTATARALSRAASARMTATVACADRGEPTCVPPPSPPSPSTKGLTRPCATPPADVCSALGCPTCASASDLATCISTQITATTDGLAAALLGVAR
jgi:glucose/arabinose dehydrogenase